MKNQTEKEIEEKVHEIIATMRLSGFELTDNEKDLLRRIAREEALYKLDNTYYLQS